MNNELSEFMNELSEIILSYINKNKEKIFKYDSDKVWIIGN